MNRLLLYWHTIRYLTPRQLTYQLLNRLRPRPRLRPARPAPEGHPLAVLPESVPASGVATSDATFTLLNVPVHFGGGVDWNHHADGKLWTYALTGFDFLNEPGDAGAQLRLLRAFVRQGNAIQAGLEPYPTSLRIVNWVRFLSRHGLREPEVEAHLYAQIGLLRGRVEYHLAGNHLLENAIALVTGALYFRHRRWFGPAARLLRQELDRQLLRDGGHEERSPVYHRLLLDRLLDLTYALRHDHWHADPALTEALGGAAARMLGWLGQITFANGDTPDVNDAARYVAPSATAIRQKAAQLGIRPRNRPLYDSGYRLFRRPAYELLADVGAVGPDHQPGHAHADTLAFLLCVRQQPVLVDTGTSTYAPGERRQRERSTAAHNTVTVADRDSSVVWHTFRVGQRARAQVIAENDSYLFAGHTGYTALGVVHERAWECHEQAVTVTDQLISRGGRTTGTARFHFHPDVAVALSGQTATAGPLHLTLRSPHPFRTQLVPYDMADGFNRLRPALCLEVFFTQQLETRLTVTE